MNKNDYQVKMTINKCNLLILILWSNNNHKAEQDIVNIYILKMKIKDRLKILANENSDFDL